MQGPTNFFFLSTFPASSVDNIKQTPTALLGMNCVKVAGAVRVGRAQLRYITLSCIFRIYDHRSWRPSILCCLSKKCQVRPGCPTQARCESRDTLFREFLAQSSSRAEAPQLPTSSLLGSLVTTRTWILKFGKSASLVKSSRSRL